MHSTLPTHRRSKEQKVHTFNTKNASEEGSLLFINNHITNGSQNVHRPDRRTVGSHVQRVIRKRKQLNTTLRLMPRIIAPVNFEHRSKNSKGDERSLLDGRRSLSGRDSCHPDIGPSRLQPVRWIWSSSEHLNKDRMLVLDDNEARQVKILRPLPLCSAPEGSIDFAPMALKCCKLYLYYIAHS